MLILVALLGACYAQEEEEFTYRVPSPKGVFFYETFQDDLVALNWSPSSDEKFKEGEWKIGAGDHIQALATETGLIVTEAARHHAISTKFPVAFDPASADEIVIQYEVRFEKSHECGGAYIKVLQDSDTFKPESFNDQDGYIVMFGPDKCSSTDKVHLIIKHQNPVSKEFEEKHLKTPPRIKNDRNTHLYTAVLRKDNTYEVFIDSVSTAKGSLLTDFEPAFQPPKEIDDPEDTKPEDWVDDEKMNDPEVSKPDDWDEDAPAMIDDDSAEKPVGWGDDEPLEIPDPEAEKPEDWDDEDDGDWEAPMVKNPICVNVGCGEWQRPRIPNPAYQGKWIHPQVDNPDYKGEWFPQKIPNANFFECTDPYGTLHKMGGVGIEIWTMQEGIQFDNVLVDYSLASAQEFSGATFAMKQKAEKVASEAGGLSSMMESVAEAFQENTAIAVSAIIGVITLIGLIVWFACCGDDHPQFEEPAEVQRTEEDDGDDKDEEDEDDKKEDKKKKVIDLKKGRHTST